MKAVGNKKVQVYESLKRRIIDCELVPGLPINEADFATDLGVSKTPIREALRQLERDGFVDSIPGRGSTISHITSSDIREIFEIREIIETGAAKRYGDQCVVLSMDVKRVDSSFHVLKHTTYPVTLSDHRPVSVELAWVAK